MAYNDLIVIQSVTEARSDLGEVTETWATFQESWADIETLSGNEGFTTDMIVYSDTKKFIIHYEEGKSVTGKMRISYDSKIFDITSVNHMDRLRTELIAVEKDDE